MPWGLSTSLPPPGNSAVTRCATVALFSAEECAAIIGSCRDDGWGEGAIAPESLAGDMRLDAEYRRVSIHPIIDAQAGAVERILAAVHAVNEQVFRLDVWGIVANDGPSVMRYDAGHGHYLEHPDIGHHAPTRKLSFTTQLSRPDAYQGGDLVVGGEAMSRDLGALHIFPSFLPHEVRAVDAGQRFALVGWVHGPTFH